MINIFEHNTPLHDGAVIVKGNRVTSATCYLPLTDRVTLSKALGTRHRAGVGISEATDAITVIVSEETGRISIAVDGDLKTNCSSEELKIQLMRLLKLVTNENEAKVKKTKTKKERKGKIQA